MIIISIAESVVVVGTFLQEIIIIIMGNDVSTGRSAYLERQLSNASGKDIQTLQGFYSDFRNECPTGKRGVDFAGKCFKSTAFKGHNTALQNKGEEIHIYFHSLCIIRSSVPEQVH